MSHWRDALRSIETCAPPRYIIIVPVSIFDEPSAPMSNRIRPWLGPNACELSLHASNTASTPPPYHGPEPSLGAYITPNAVGSSAALHGRHTTSSGVVGHS